jgi:hypothetical protein
MAGRSKQHVLSMRKATSFMRESWLVRLNQAGCLEAIYIRHARGMQARSDTAACAVTA